MSLVVLPSTVEELNYIQNSLDFQSTNISTFAQPIHQDSSRDFENIRPVARNYKREYSLPNGVQWDVHDFRPYLTFEENNVPISNFEVINSQDDRLGEEQRVPGEEQRQRSESISSVTSSMDDKTVVYQNMGVKTYSTVRMDSGSTCISSDHSFINLTPPSVFKDLESEETFQNLNQYITQGPDTHNTDTVSSISSASSPLNDHLDYSVLSNFSLISNNSNDSYSNQSVSMKRSTASPDEEFLSMNSTKRFRGPSNSSHYQDVRKKNNIASKNCRKTRKEKQKEMDSRVIELEKEGEDLRNQIRYLETMTSVFKKHIHAIMKPRNGLLANGIPNNNIATTSLSSNVIP